jgi:hypothetical protein
MMFPLVCLVQVDTDKLALFRVHQRALATAAPIRTQIKQKRLFTRKFVPASQ